jgi:hypothetical protein
MFGGKQQGFDFSSAAPISYSTPTVPSVPDPGIVNNDGTETATEAAMNDSADKEKQEALKRLQAGQTTFTSALGAPGLANTYRKQLLGV